MNKLIIHKRLFLLRLFMEEKGLQAFVVPSTDAHLSEYPAPHWEARQWISGFTGSAGTVAITINKAGLWTDSRYFLQADNELRGTGIQLYKDGVAGTPTIEDWLVSTLKDGDRVGIDGSVYAAGSAMKLNHRLNIEGIQLVSDYDPFASIWDDRPHIPENKIFALPEKYAGESAHSKISRICKNVKAQGAGSLLVASLDTIAWIFNIRGNDVKCNPVAVCFACISDKETVLFINPEKLTDEVARYLKEEGIIIADYEKVYDYVSRLSDSVIWADTNKISFKLYNCISASTRIIEALSPADTMKSIKNETEQKGIRSAMERDGVALVRFLMWLEKTAGKEKIEETDIPAKLIEYRSQQDNYVGESFDTIAGYGANGAIVHYHATSDSSLEVKSEGFFLIDSGAQYFDGTTDITRTIAMGALTDQMKEDYTLVLKGHIGIATAIFPQGTRGSQIDILARKALWDRGLNYGHGTGHGVGHFLNVHEGPQNIRMEENPATLEVGMITSNEPGIYRAGKYGIRIENLVCTRHEKKTEFGCFYSFETLTLCPIDKSPVVKELLSQEEIEWFNRYHAIVYDRLSPFLDEEEKVWLKNKTDEI